MDDPVAEADERESYYLTLNEFESLTEDDQARYLELLEAEAGEWTLDLAPQIVADRILKSGVDELLYGGAAGGGKSELALYHALELSRTFANHRSLIIRRTFPELRRSLIGRSLHRYAPHATYKVADKEWHFANGSVIEFGHCGTAEDVRQYLSAEYQLIVIDECTDFTGDEWEELRGRLRALLSMTRLGVRPHMLGCTNPGGIGHAYFKTRFVDATNYGEDLVTKLDDEFDESSVRTVGFVQSKVTDNHHLDPTYRHQLQALSNPVRRAQLLDGSWDVFEGQYFTEFDRDLHVIPAISEFAIPDSWPKVTGHDHGYTNPFCHLWCAFDNDGRAYIYREAYDTELTPVQQAKMIASKERGESIDWRACDPSIWTETGAGLPIAQQLGDAGLRGLRRANNARVDGWTRVREYLRIWPDGRPGVVFFETGCPNLIRTIPLQLHDKLKPEDLNTKLEDHAVDALRYLLMSRNRRPPEAKKEPGTYDEMVWAKVRARAKAKRRKVKAVIGLGG